MRTFCIFLGMVAIACKLQIGAAFALLALKWAWLPNLISVAAALGIAHILILKPQVPRRWQGPEWMSWAFAAAGAASILLGSLSPWDSLHWRLGFRATAVLEAVADIALLGLFLKIALDTRPDDDTERSYVPNWRLFMALWLVISTAFLTPALVNLWMGISDNAFGTMLTDLKAVFSGEAYSGTSAWLGWAGWLLAAGAAVGVMGYGHLADRIPGHRPGVRMMTVGLAMVVLASAPMLGLGRFQANSNMIVALVAFAVLIAPAAVIGNALMAVGLFRLLLNLEAEDGDEPAADEAAPDEPAAPTPQPPAVPAPALTVTSVREQIAARPQDAVLHQQLHGLLLADPAAGADLLAHARQFLALLVRQSRADHAYTVLKACMARDASFKPDADQVLPLANLAQAHGESMIALRLMHEFDRRHPGHPATPGVYYLSARVLRSQNKFPPAAKILDLLLQRFPNDPIAGQARSLRQALEQLIAAPAAPAPVPAPPKPG